MLANIQTLSIQNGNKENFKNDAKLTVQRSLIGNGLCGRVVAQKPHLVEREWGQKSKTHKDWNEDHRLHLGSGGQQFQSGRPVHPHPSHPHLPPAPQGGCSGFPRTLPMSLLLWYLSMQRSCVSTPSQSAG